MRYLLCFLLILPRLSKAQADGVVGLAHYVIGITTPDLLNTADFREQDQPLVKGTLALLCTHVRTFTASRLTLDSIPATNLVLHFYDNRLFRIDCDYNALLEKAFTRKFGPGVHIPATQLRACSQGKDRFMTMWGESWPGEKINTSVVRWTGYTAACQPEEGAKLILWSQSVSALCSECDLQPVNPFVEEYRQTQPGK